MRTSQSLFDDPVWQGLAREADLSTQLICMGANEIGRADAASQGRYAAAQFGFANGLERLGKLILTSDNLLSAGVALSDSQLRSVGHSIASVLDSVEAVVDRRGLDIEYRRPASVIARKTLEAFDDFASASRGRYANHSSISGTPSQYEPIGRWWEMVCEPVLDKHFRGKSIEVRAVEESQAVGMMLVGVGVVHHFHENGTFIADAETVSYMSHEREVTQRWGRFYSLVHARWLAEVFTILTKNAGYQSGTEYFMGHYERVQTFRMPNNILRNRKNWPVC